MSLPDLHFILCLQILLLAWLLCDLHFLIIVLHYFQKIYCFSYSRISPPPFFALKSREYYVLEIIKENQIEDKQVHLLECFKVLTIMCIIENIANGPYFRKRRNGSSSRSQKNYSFCNICCISQVSLDLHRVNPLK